MMYLLHISVKTPGAKGRPYKIKCAYFFAGPVTGGVKPEVEAYLDLKTNKDYAYRFEGMETRLEYGKQIQCVWLT